jgi:predicted CoA-binding protein
MVQQKKTVVLGASSNPSRYSNMAVRRLESHGHHVIAIGRKKGSIGNTAIETDQLAITDVDTVTLYLNPDNQVAYYDYILSLNPRRIIFNPGTENEEFFQRAKEQGIKPLEACTLVMLSTNQY